MKRNTIIKDINNLNLVLYKALIRRYRELEVDITPVHSRIIMFIYNKGIEVCQKDIEEFLSCSKSTLSSILKTMENKELIKRTISYKDARSRLVKLTNKSKKIVGYLSKDRDIIDKLLCGGISEVELDIFFKILHKIESNVERI